MFATEDALIPFLFDFFHQNLGDVRNAKRFHQRIKGDEKPISGKM